MKKINLAITGCLGRMGQQLIKSSKKNKKFKIVSLTENKNISKRIYGIKPELNTVAAFKKASVIIDFTTPKCTIQVLKIAMKLNSDDMLVNVVTCSETDDIFLSTRLGKCIRFSCNSNIA